MRFHILTVPSLDAEMMALGVGNETPRTCKWNQISIERLGEASNSLHHRHGRRERLIS